MTNAPALPRETPATAGPLHGRVAVITGASAGIGAATARGFAAGAAVALLGRRAERIEQLADELRQDSSAEVLPSRST
ncbi:short chain dehydrogenase [Lentzea xinjiangensis]|uniref:Short chain dehydrogenase n=1 Tax=Lentzea xinjiangensis TaxID=402600 RepID=A0A1H9UDG2_9PSEU|nr:SDR family NAD(P)-dependent oxidoreductase [Lentzea xinjiangensis]SES07495.1 short chain dehydrogenase [Lentzea xinjiangensis]